MVGIKVMVTHPREILVAQAGRLVLGPGEAGEVNFRLAPGARDLLEAFMEEQAKTPKVACACLFLWLWVAPSSRVVMRPRVCVAIRSARVVHVADRSVALSHIQVKICAVCVETTDAEALLEQLRESSFWRYVPGVESCVAHVLVTADAYQLVPPPGYDEVWHPTGRGKGHWECTCGTHVAHTHAAHTRGTHARHTHAAHTLALFAGGQRYWCLLRCTAKHWFYCVVGAVVCDGVRWRFPFGSSQHPRVGDPRATVGGGTHQRVQRCGWLGGWCGARGGCLVGPVCTASE